MTRSPIELSGDRQKLSKFVKNRQKCLEMSCSNQYVQTCVPSGVLSNFPKFKCQSVGDKVIYLEWLSHSPNLLQGWYAALPGAK